MPAAPCVGPEESEDGHAEDYDCGDAGGEEGGFGGGEAGLFEEERGVLIGLVGCVRRIMKKGLWDWGLT